jgi:hypothetical protein
MEVELPGAYGPRPPGARVRFAMTGDALSRHRFSPLVEPLASHPSFIARPMFGCVGCYWMGRLVLVLADRGEPWQGLLVPTERSFQASLLEDFAALRVHPILGKWLYLSESRARFAAAAAALVLGIAGADTRFGVEPPIRRLPRRRAI